MRVLVQQTANRLGQSRAVRVIRLVTRDSIEERVLEVVQQKQALFAGLFEGDTDEIDYGGARGLEASWGHVEHVPSWSPGS